MSGRNGALIVGAGRGLSASIARKLAAADWQVSLAARDADKLGGLCDEIGGRAYTCDATDPGDVADLFRQLDDGPGAPRFVVYNPSRRVPGALVEVDPAAVKDALEVTAFGAFLVAQQATRRMIDGGGGAIFFTGASASVKGYPRSAGFAMGKFALRGLAQSMARELHPRGIHVAHFVIDGGIRSDVRPVPADNPDSLLDPDAIAETYLAVLGQHRSAWTWEVELRPWVEKF